MTRIATETYVDSQVGGNSVIGRVKTTSIDVRIANNGQTVISWDTEVEDTDTMVNLGATTANLTGTVAKTSGQNTLAGTGTAFTTQCRIGQQITVGAETKRIIDIASDTSLTV